MYGLPEFETTYDHDPGNLKFKSRTLNVLHDRKCSNAPKCKLFKLQLQQHSHSKCNISNLILTGISIEYDEHHKEKKTKIV